MGAQISPDILTEPKQNFTSAGPVRQRQRLVPSRRGAPGPGCSPGLAKRIDMHWTRRIGSSRTGASGQRRYPGSRDRSLISPAAVESVFLDANRRICSPRPHWYRKRNPAALEIDRDLFILVLRATYLPF